MYSYYGNVFSVDHIFQNGEIPDYAFKVNTLVSKIKVWELSVKISLLVTRECMSS